MGKSLIEAANNDYEVVASYFGNYDIADTARVRYSKLDLRDKEGHSKLFSEFRPQVVIHTAGIGSPDYAEKNKEETWSINVVGAQNIIKCCEELNSKLIYISSNGIYDGDNAPYGEDDEAKPVNYYGQIKLEGEINTIKSKVTHAIVRPMLMYGWNNKFERNNIITFALEKLKRGESVNIYENVFCNPISAEFCAEAIWRIIQKNIYDVFNIGGKDTLSLYQFVRTAAEIFGLGAGLVKPVQQDFFRDLVKRPKNTSYKIKVYR